MVFDGIPMATETDVPLADVVYDEQADIDYGMLMEQNFKDLRDVVDDLKLWSWFANVEPPEETGYMFWQHENLNKIRDALGDKLNHHSGASWAITLRRIQMEAKEKY